MEVYAMTFRYLTSFATNDLDTIEYLLIDIKCDFFFLQYNYDGL